MDVAAIAKVTFTRPDRVREVINNFNEDRFESLYPKYAGGRPPENTLAITVCHYPPGTSKWNRIERRAGNPMASGSAMPNSPPYLREEELGTDSKVGVCGHPASENGPRSRLSRRVGATSRA
jgi:hypothetical protein